MSIDLYTWQYCPFAQRTRIALAVKGIEHNEHELDITKKPYPDWFMKLSPNGKVPTLVHDGRPLYESEVISEYVDEVFDGPKLLPEDPYQRAVVRLLIAYGSEKFVPLLYKLLRNQDEARDEELKAQALDAWRWIDARLREFGSGDKFLFDGPTLAEYSFGPFFQRWRIVEHYRYFDVPDTPEFSRIRAWREVSEGLDIVRDTAPSTETLIKVYADYARNYDNAKIPPGREFSAFDTEAWPLEQRPMPVRGLRLNSKE